MNPLLTELEGRIPADLFNALATLPPSLALARIAYKRATPDTVRQRRGAFSTIKSEFLQYMANHHAENLRAMNLTDQSIEAMRLYGMFPQNRPGERMDMSVDHKRSLSMGGDNGFDNLMLLPDRFNALKDELEKAQRSDTTNTQASLITILPADPGDQIPFIPGGFAKASRKSKMPEHA
ncbi:MAG: hypothetical protein H6865_03570 [Rhodospirillales bacterium]|nr:hypothetical protein [Alphaproteobacteria bacterium]MCB9986696.1 hypothetical protein [Rhodospirillales bacterium]USO06779.1 MAG: hypothetical protein H6866_04815 [Rhodospirillales bacterium]